MYPDAAFYHIWPSVVPADQPVELTIAPAEKCYIMPEGEEYTLTIIPMNGDAYNRPESLFEHTKLTLRAREGVLHLSYTFAGEQEHLLQLSKADKTVQELSVYSLAPDLYALRPMKGDFHAHSRRSDGRQDPAALIGHYREQGYEFMSLTDHHRYYPGREIDAAYQEVKLPITRVEGEEVHFPGNVVHIVHVGGRASVSALYLTDKERCLSEVEQYQTRVPDAVPEQYRYRYAACQWVCDRIHEAGGLAILAHPYWRPHSLMYNLNDELTRILLCSGMFDAYELVGGMGQVGINRSVNLWNELRAERGLGIPVVASSDVHNVGTCSRFANCFTLCFAENEGGDALCDALRQSRCVAVESTGEGKSREYRCYGSVRLVSYAQFLLKNYYPRLQRICQGEGVAMRAWAMGDADWELVERQNEQSERFRLRFFGRLGAPTPSPELLASEAYWGGVPALDSPELLSRKERLYPLR